MPSVMFLNDLTNCHIPSGKPLLTPDNPYLTVAFVFEFGLMVVSLIAVVLVITGVARTALLHRNLVIIIIQFCIVYILGMAGRFTVFLHQIKVFEADPDCTRYMWLAIFAREFFVCSICYSGILILIERSFATCCSRNYEKRKRSWITAAIMLPYYIVSMTHTLSYSYAMFTATWNIVICLLLSLIQMTYWMILRRINVKKLSHCESNTGCYLTTRYQLTENIRLLETLRTTALSICALVVLAVTMLGAGLLMDASHFSSITLEFYEIMVAIAPIVVSVCFVKDINRYELVREGFSLKMRRITISTEELPTFDDYFKTLAKSWE